MQSAVFRWLVCIMATIAVIAVSCSSKKEEAKREEVRTEAAKEEPNKEPHPTVTSPPPKGQWKAVEEKSGGLPMVLTVNLENYSSATDVKAVAESAPQGDYKAKIESFGSHGGMQVGQQFTTQDGKTMVVGQFWSPQFVTAKQLGDTWEITIVSGSPFIEKEKAKPQDVGFIELTVPVKGGGGTARLYMATQVAYENGQLVPNAPDSEAKVLRITSFVPSDDEAPTGKNEVSPPSRTELKEGIAGSASIPERFQGTWFEAKEGAKLVISRDKLVWVKKVFDEMREEVHEAKAVKVSPDGRTLSFTSKHVYSRDVFFPKREYSAPIKVTLHREDASLRVTVGEMRIEEQPGMIVSHPGSTHVYRLSGDPTNADPGSLVISSIRVSISNPEDDGFVSEIAKLYAGESKGPFLGGERVSADELRDKTTRYAANKLKQTLTALGLFDGKAKGCLMNVTLKLSRGNWSSVTEEGGQTVAQGIWIEAKSNISDPSGSVLKTYSFSGGLVSQYVIMGIASPQSQWGYVTGSINMFVGHLLKNLAKDGIKTDLIVRLLLESHSDGSEYLLPRESDVELYRTNVRVHQKGTLWEAMAEIAKPKALISCLRDKDREVRYSAVRALGEIGGKTAIDALVNSLDTKDEEFVKWAAKWLKHATSQNFGSDANNWREWWKRNQDR